MSEGPFTGAFRVFARLLEARTGQILSENRVWRIETALTPILRANDLASLDALVAALSAGQGRRLADQVVDALLNNESSFFRDLQVFDMLGRDLLPHLAATRPGRTLRIWCAGCSTGQEAYSLAMLFSGNADLWQDWRISILATDISSAAISQARSGLYSQIDVQRGLPIGDLLRWFEPVGDDWKVKDELRRMVDFRQDNLFDSHAPNGAYDLIFCRNVLLYFSNDMRRRVFDLLTRHSHDSTFLLMGAGETVIGQTDEFAASRDYRGSYARRPAGQPVPQTLARAG
ncbi:protein-glutamate O-methyltransferase CheR [Sphingobium aquiterrae]|uniref:CheR family methyltransferase n=1 Tax=Sphingobium aquiterrae TaxID=2038656 RepID=UPI003019B5C3